MTATTLDTSDIDQYLGKPVDSSSLREPIATNDIRRWVHAMHYPNLLHYDPDYAAASRWGKIIAPQSICIATDDGHGAAPACVGNIPDSHLLFGGDEHWFYGPRVQAGDIISNERVPFDYVVKETKFAGPTCFQRGDNNFTNQNGELILKQRSTSIRYNKEAGSETVNTDDFEETTWTDEEEQDIIKRRFGWVQMLHNLGHKERWWDDVQVGDDLPERVFGPHSIASFATEWRAYIVNTWGIDELAQAGPCRRRLRPGDGRAGKRSRHDEDRSVPDRRRLLRAVARALVPRLGAPHRHAARLWLRCLDGRLGHRLSCRLGGRARHGRALHLELPWPRADGRPHGPDR